MKEARERLIHLLAGGGRQPAVTTTLAETRLPVGERPNYSIALGLRKASASPINDKVDDAALDVDALVAASRKVLGAKLDDILSPAALAAIKADPEVAKRFANALVGFREDHKQQLADQEEREAKVRLDTERAERTRLATIGQTLAKAEREP